MFTVSDIIHLIQYYYKSSNYDSAAADVETFRLESLRGESSSYQKYPWTLMGGRRN
jgi:5'-AMP-activated protein kinase, regulatory gamma subunit